jgi:hypothetical protein
MRDQSHGRLNGSAAAAFATICERNRNTGSILRERRRIRRRFVGQRYAQRIAKPSRAIAKLFCDDRSDAGSVNEKFFAAKTLQQQSYSVDRTLSAA